MEGLGIIANIIGAALVMYSQLEMNRTISMWLTSLDMTVEGILSRGDTYLIRGIDKHWDKDLKCDKWLSAVGWSLFMAGYFLLAYVYMTKA